ncbi:hypothetical protein HPB47_005776 [Ixodes persulcatus]|uniref:Uncharacterized protein n=1 Tax=Ixodes persulcatus TaxID=34615 RepID=A0AC60PDA3_IXOPE|nr:hypothetical protein HPB47_005776 [Ixodes persulcatus]
MIGLLEKLNEIEGLNHSIYVDDITLWVAGGSDGLIQDTLQEAMRTVEEYVIPRGLACFPQKSELLLLKPVRARQLPSDIGLFSQGNRIPTVKSIRDLGRNYGMKEKNLVRLVRAFVVSRLACILPFLRLDLAEKSKLNCLIRKSYEKALNTPDSTSNEKLAALGFHNKVEEIKEAQRISQLERLSKSVTGRHILTSLGIHYERQTVEMVDVAEEVAIALAIQTNVARIIVSDLQQAIRQFAKGIISPITLKVLGRCEKKISQVVWTPAHSSLPGNEEAHSAARELANRAEIPLDPSTTSLTEGNRLPPAHSSLDKKTSVAWRRLHTGSYTSPSLLTEQVVSRQIQANLQALRRLNPYLKKINSQESWEALLLSTDRNVQEHLVQLAEDATGTQWARAAV